MIVAGLVGALLDLMVEAGVHVERYHPLHWYHLARMNNRTHRITFEAWQARPWQEKILEHASALLSSQL